jgi:hypothetical protein
MEIIIGKFETQNEFESRGPDGFVVSTNFGRQPYIVHRPQCAYLFSAHRRHQSFGRQYATYWVAALETIRHIWPDVVNCHECLPSGVSVPASPGVEVEKIADWAHPQARYGSGRTFPPSVGVDNGDRLWEADHKVGHIGTNL